MLLAVMPPSGTHGGGDARVPARRDPREMRPPAGADAVERVRAALSDIAVGRPVVVDHHDGGDLVVAAELATPQLLSFMVRHTSGFVCVAVTEDDADRLDLPLMVRTHHDRPDTAQCVAVDARAGVSTGISAADRATTIRLLAAPGTAATDLVRPGHVIPLRARPEGVLGRRGRAETAVDLAALAGLRPAGVLCELVSTTDPRGMARGPELVTFAREHGLHVITPGDLVAYRMRSEKMVERGSETAVSLTAGRFTAVSYRNRLDGREHLALVHGEIGDGEDVPVRLHRECLIGDTLGSTRCSCGPRLQSALAGIADEGRGIVVYLRGEAESAHLRHEDVRQRRQDPGEQMPVGVDGLHEDVIGGQILRDLGIQTVRPLDRKVLDERCAQRMA